METLLLRDARTLNPGETEAGVPGTAEDTLSVAYLCPSWPPGNDSNGIVPYIGMISEQLRAKGHVTTVMTHQLEGEDQPSDGIYRLSADRAHWTLLDRIAFRIRPVATFHRMTSQSIVAGALQAIR